MRILFDTNVVLDHLLDRQPFAQDASPLIEYVVQELLDGVLCATTLTTIYYISSRNRNESFARSQTFDLVRQFDIASVDRRVLRDAFNSDFTDYEDAVLHEAAGQADVDGIVTRNQRDFRSARLQVFAPAELLRVV